MSSLLRKAAQSMFDIMLNSTRINYFNKLFLLLKLKLISNKIHCFNEDTYHVEDFYLNDWENYDDQVEKGSYVTIGVI